MSGEWENVRIQDIAERVAMGPFGSSIKVSTFVTDGVPVISGQHLKGTRLDDREFNYVTEEHAGRLKSANVQRGDIVFTHAGSIGQAAYIPSDSMYNRYVLSQRQFSLRLDSKKAIPEYVVYYFHSYAGRHKLLANTSQTGVPSIAQPVTYLRSIEIPLPPLPEQRRIAKILGDLDDKIELNRTMNETLEQMARALFKSWFVDFDPVHAKMEGRTPTGMDAATAALFPDRLVDSELGPIPEGWEVKALDSIATFLNGLALQKFPASGGQTLKVIKIAQLRAGNTVGADECSSEVPGDYIIEDGDVLFSWSGSLEVELWCGGSGALNQHLFKVTSNETPKWFYYQWLRQHLSEFREIAADKATTMGHIQRRHLTEALVLVPCAALITTMTNAMQPIHNQLINNNIQSRTLSTLRDTLLPKLVSGEVRVGVTSER
jgi:type I restriction enzyme S subunit